MQLIMGVKYQRLIRRSTITIYSRNHRLEIKYQRLIRRSTITHDAEINSGE